MEVECCKEEIVLASRSAWVYVHVLSCMHTRTPVFLSHLGGRILFPFYLILSLSLCVYKTSALESIERLF